MGQTAKIRPNRTRPGTGKVDRNAIFEIEPQENSLYYETRLSELKIVWSGFIPSRLSILITT